MMNEDNYIDQNSSSDANSFLSIGDVYYRGFGVSVDYSRAFSFYMKAAQMGHAHALCKVAMCYENGLGVKKDYRVAKRYYETAAQQNDILAMIRLGDLYWNGYKTIIPQDTETAADYYLDALDELEVNETSWFSADVFLRLAKCLIEGIGVAVDYDKAAVFLDIAINGFNTRIQLGDTDCEKDLEQAEILAEQCRLHLTSEDLK